MENAELTHPLVYELNTRSWLMELTERTGQPVTLATVPDEAIAGWAADGFTHIWLMGVWSTGPRSRRVAVRDQRLRDTARQILGRWAAKDVAGSPFAIADYRIPRRLGGEKGLAAFRRRLESHGMRLLLDFVPNHVGLDHPWLSQRPELFVPAAPGSAEAFAHESPAGTSWFAHGRDPYFPAWADTAQLDYRRPETHAAMIELLGWLAERCDGVRCDMAMLVLGDVFARVWERHPCAGLTTLREFWADAIAIVRARHPDFLFLAEAYWDLEPRLVSLGFDYVYDKPLYDHVVGRRAGQVQRHLLERAPDVLLRSVHFLENHDEARIAGVLSLAEHRAAALLMLGLPGLRLLHDGQLTGARIRQPVQLLPRPRESANAEVVEVYQRLLRTLPTTAVGHGKGALLPPMAAWPGNPTAENIIAVQWQRQREEFNLVAVNLAPHRSQCYLRLTVPELASRNWQVKDLLGDAVYERYGDDLQRQGLYLDLVEHGAQLFHFHPIA